MVPRCHKQALWKDRGHLFNHGIPEESQWDTQFVPLLLSHKFNCFSRMTKKLIQPLKTTLGSRWIYVCAVLWSTLWKNVCTPCFRWIAITATSWYLSVYLQTQKIIDSGKCVVVNTQIPTCLVSPNFSLCTLLSIPNYFLESSKFITSLFFLFILPRQIIDFHPIWWFKRSPPSKKKRKKKMCPYSCIDLKRHQNQRLHHMGFTSELTHTHKTQI